MFPIKESKDGITFNIKVVPRSSRCEFAGIQEGVLRIKITAPPVEGLANEECIRFLSKKLGIAKSRIKIVAGLQAKKKVLFISGLNGKDLEALIHEPA
jgi:uncharacterized protein